MSIFLEYAAKNAVTEEEKNEVKYYSLYLKKL